MITTPHSPVSLEEDCFFRDGIQYKKNTKIMWIYGFGTIELAYPRHFLLKCLYQARKVNGHVFVLGNNHFLTLTTQIQQRNIFFSSRWQHKKIFSYNAKSKFFFRSARALQYSFQKNLPPPPIRKWLLP